LSISKTGTWISESPDNFDLSIVNVLTLPTTPNENPASFFFFSFSSDNDEEDLPFFNF
jgi:hypothetical protein